METNASSVTYEYDAFGNKIEATTVTYGTAGYAPSTTTSTVEYAIDQWNPDNSLSVGKVWADLNAANGLQTRYIGDNNTNQLVARIDTTATTAYFYVLDRQNSTRDIIAANNAALLDTVNYDAYGNIISETSPTYGGDYKYTGEQFDAVTGLQYNDARWYDPNTGRWMSQDPMGFGAGDSNLYRYVNNAPTDGVDPSGMDIGPAAESYYRGILGSRDINVVPDQSEEITRKFSLPRIPLSFPFGELTAGVSLSGSLFYRSPPNEAEFSSAEFKGKLKSETKYQIPFGLSGGLNGVFHFQFGANVEFGAQVVSGVDVDIKTLPFPGSENRHITLKINSDVGVTLFARAALIANVSLGPVVIFQREGGIEGSIQARYRISANISFDTAKPLRTLNVQDLTAAPQGPITGGIYLFQSRNGLFRAGAEQERWQIFPFTTDPFVGWGVFHRLFPGVFMPSSGRPRLFGGRFR